MLSDNDLQLASAVLAKCAAYDPWFPRPDGEQAHATVKAWATTFASSGLEPEFIFQGVDRFYEHAEADKRVMPATIVTHAKDVRREKHMRMSDEQIDVFHEAALQTRIRAGELGISDHVKYIHLPKPGETVEQLVKRTLDTSRRKAEERKEIESA